MTIASLSVATALLAPQIGGLKWEPFEVPNNQRGKMAAELAWLEVPEYRANPKSQKLKLAIVRMKCLGTPVGPPVVYLSGGPGSAASNETWQPVFERIRLSNDVILLDQRGTGMTTPKPNWDSNTSVPLDFFTSWNKAQKFYRDINRRAAADLKKRGFDMRGYTPVESADDVNDLRIALGLKKINVLGFSYGTHLGLATLRRHGKHIENAVLVGTEGVDETMKLPSTYDRQIQKLSELVAADPTVGAKMPNMIEVVKRVLERAAREPFMVEVLDRRAEKRVTVPVGKFGLQLIIRIDVGDGFDFIDFPALFATLDKGDVSVLQKYVEKRYNGFGGGVSGMSVVTDTSSGVSSQRLMQIEAEAKVAILGNTMNFPGDVADIWGKPDLGLEYRKPVTSNVRTLFVSGTMDVQTPPYQAEFARWGFSRGFHTVVEYAGHEDMLWNDAVNTQIAEFLGGKDPMTNRLSVGWPKFKPIP